MLWGNIMLFFPVMCFLGIAGKMGGRVSTLARSDDLGQLFREDFA